MIKNRVEKRIEQAVVQMAIDNPALGQVRVLSNELRKKGILVSPEGVRSIWLRHDIETFQKQLKALSTKVKQEGIVLDENQMAALEKTKAEKQAHREIETYYPGFLVAQDTYYVGYIKGVGHIYQQTVIDTYSKLASPSSTTERTRLWRLTCSMTGWFRSSNSMTFLLNNIGSKICDLFILFKI